MKRLLWLLGVLILGARVQAQTVAFTDSNLPIISIDTRGQTIQDEPKAACRVRVIANRQGQRNYLTDPARDYDGWAGVELRGASSQTFPKKSYGFELWTDSAGTASVDSSLAGLPAESDWVLSASYSDKTLLRNALTYHLARQLGSWAPRTAFCELVLNDQYQGVYVLIEKVKRGGQRLDIGKLNAADTTGSRLQGGYIVKVDREFTDPFYATGWTSAFPPPQASGQTTWFGFEYPKYDRIQQQQADYIRAYIDSFEIALAGPQFQNPQVGYAHFADPASFVDYYLISEACRNVDGYRLSTFLHKDRASRGDGRLKAGPVWDYDLAWRNADYCNGANTTGFAWQFNSVCGWDSNLVPFWWTRLLQDPTFRNEIRCRWTTLGQPGQPLATPVIYRWIDSAAAVLQEGQQRNFTEWPILGQYVWPNPQPIPADYAGEIAALKNWIGARFYWLNANLPGTCSTTGLPTSNGLLSDAAAATLWPNPTTGGQVACLTFALTQEAEVGLEVTDLLGRIVAASAPVRLAAGVRTLPIPGISTPGLYSVSLHGPGGTLVTRRLVVNP